MAVTESVTESVFSIALDISYKHENFTIIGSEKVFEGVCF